MSAKWSTWSVSMRYIDEAAAKGYMDRLRKLEGTQAKMVVRKPSVWNDVTTYIVMTRCRLPMPSRRARLTR